MYIVVSGHKKAAPVLFNKLARATHLNLTVLLFVVIKCPDYYRSTTISDDGTRKSVYAADSRFARIPIPFNGVFR